VLLFASTQAHTIEHQKYFGLLLRCPRAWK
jgi:hypothetical protein